MDAAEYLVKFQFDIWRPTPCSGSVWKLGVWKLLLSVVEVQEGSQSRFGGSLIPRHHARSEHLEAMRPFGKSAASAPAAPSATFPHRRRAQHGEAGAVDKGSLPIDPL